MEYIFGGELGYRTKLLLSCAERYMSVGELVHKTVELVEVVTGDWCERTYNWCSIGVLHQIALELFREVHFYE